MHIWLDVSFDVCWACVWADECALASVIASGDERAHTAGVVSWGNARQQKQSRQQHQPLWQMRRACTRADDLYLFSLSLVALCDTSASAIPPLERPPYGNMPAEYECHYIDAAACDVAFLLLGAFLCVFLARKQPFWISFQYLGRDGGVCANTRRTLSTLMLREWHTFGIIVCSEREEPSEKYAGGVRWCQMHIIYWNNQFSISDKNIKNCHIL